MKRTPVAKKERLFIEESNFLHIIDTLFFFPDVEFSLTEIAEKSNVAKSAASRIIPKLQNAGIVTVQEGVVHRIKANFDSVEYVKRKIIWNLQLIYSTALVEYLDEYFHRPKAIVVFGSFRLGQDSTGSDIDIAIETTESGDFRSMYLKELKTLEDFFQRRIQLHIFNRKNIDEGLFANIANGIVLSGYLEVRP